MSFIIRHAARWFGLMNILGDVFVFLSGGAYDSIFRQMAAASGIVANLIMLRYGEGRAAPRAASMSAQFRRLMRPRDYPVDVGMSLILFSGLCYIASGIHQFEVEGRPQESCLGFFIALACLFMLRRQPHIGSGLFLCGSLFSLTMPLMFRDVIDAYAREGLGGMSALWAHLRLDGYLLVAVMCFLSANYLARHVGKSSKIN